MPENERQSRSAKDGRTSNAQTFRFPTFHLLWVDMFGPFMIKQHRNEVKHYGVMFICMGITHSLDTGSFIQALISKLFFQIMAAILLAVKTN